MCPSQSLDMALPVASHVSVTIETTSISVAFHPVPPKSYSSSGTLAPEYPAPPPYAFGSALPTPLSFYPRSVSTTITAAGHELPDYRSVPKTQAERWFWSGLLFAPLWLAGVARLCYPESMLGPGKHAFTANDPESLATDQTSGDPFASVQLWREEERLWAMRSAGTSAPRKKRTILDLHSFKRRKVPITMLTAHDYPSARFIEASASPPSAAPPTGDVATAPAGPRGIDICLVGDSLAMVACGYTSTTSLTLDEMLYHCRSVARGCQTSLLLADMPFGSYTASLSQAVTNASRMIQEGNMDAVKIEGGEEIVDTISRLTEIGIPVMAHIGLTPQRQSSLSGYRVQGKTVDAAYRVYQDALAVQAAGAFAVLVEAVPAKLAQFISERLDVPTIGIGAGVGCDGQVLVQLDMMGVSSLEKGPKFLKTYANLETVATGAVKAYVDDVRARTFPEEKHGYGMDETEWQSFVRVVEEMEPANE